MADTSAAPAQSKLSTAGHAALFLDSSLVSARAATHVPAWKGAVMLFDAAAAIRQVLSPPFRSVLWKTLGLTLALLALVWAGLDGIIVENLRVPYPWLATVLSILTGVGLFVGLAFLVAPTSSLVAGFFLDELAERVEAEIGGPDQVGRALPAGTAMWLAARFAAVSVLVNMVALLLLFVPGVNVIAFILANAYLLG